MIQLIDFIILFLRYAGEDGDPGLLDEMHDQLRMTIQKTFNVTPELAAKLHEELIQCVKRKHLVSQLVSRSVSESVLVWDFEISFARSHVWVLF